jgi:hypothetical protein
VTAEADRIRKRMSAARRRHGNCCLCVHREQTFGIYHCRNREHRSHGACSLDQAEPQFVFDDAVIKEFEDGNR